MEHVQETHAEDAELLAAIEDSSENYLQGRGGLSVPRERRALVHDVLPRAEFDRADWKAISELGWPGILVPPELGGLGLGLRAGVAVARKVGRWLAPEPFTACAGVAATLLARAGTDAATQLLASVLSGDRIVGVALDLEEQLASGRLACRVEEAGGVRRLSGTVAYAVPADPSDGWLLVARAENGERLLLHVGAGEAGVNIEHLLELDGRSRASLHLSDVLLDRRAVIAEGAVVPDLVRAAIHVGRVLCAAELLGAAQRLLETTIDYTSQRKQFGKAIGSFQVLQHRCVDVLIQIDLANACTEQAASAQDLGSEAHGMRAKLRACRAAIDAALTAVQLHGAMGVTDECDVGLYLKRILALAPRFGTERELQERWLEIAIESDESPPEAAEVAGDWHGEFPKAADWSAMPDEQFRSMLRAFLARNYPQHMRNMPRRVHWEEIGDWYRCLSQQGWIAPAWPTKHGGMGLPAAKQLAWFEEFEGYGVARAPDQGILMVGPVLMQYGNAEQQSRFLPKILSGENIWCQGYSEPNAGSDLASLRTEAVLEGDEFVVTGQKIWTTLAQDATHIFMLVRTDKSAKQQAGISFLLCDLATPGITVRPIRDLAGHSEFCEVFFDKVRVPRDNLVGELNQGWTIAKALLGFERLHLGSPKQVQHALGQLRSLAQLKGLMQDTAFRAAYAELALDVADLASIYSRYGDAVKRGEKLPPSVSILKVFATETYQRIGLAIARHAGSDAALARAVAVGGGSMHLLAPLFNANAAKIYGGSNEIQRNILARTVLEMPAPK